jgi:hypothetical protein
MFKAVGPLPMGRAASSDEVARAIVWIRNGDLCIDIPWGTDT